VDRPLRLLLVLGALALALAVAGCAGSDSRASQVHLAAGRAHALAVDPGDGTILVGTDHGLFRATAGGRLQRVGPAGRAVTGLAFAADGALLASGHPAPGAAGPEDLGLQRSDDGGRTWRPVSLDGQADLHLLRAVGARLYGLNSTTGTLMAATDAGRRWDVRSTPPGLTDLAVDPRAARNLVGSSDSTLWRSTDGAGTWSPTTGPAGAVAWAGSGRVIVASLDARLHESPDGGRSWTIVGRVPALLVALAERRGTLLGLLANAGVVASRDGGRHWALVARP
jgi:photosystem II stability/assembly factor-like uncharacterized protein